LRHVNWSEAEISPRRIQNDAWGIFRQSGSRFAVRKCPVSNMARGPTAKPVPIFAGRALHFPEQCLCLGINRAAQNGSRTALKMLTFAAMRCP
jgi:hypothetical protein